MTSAHTQDLRELAETAFGKDLPQLWIERPGQWVAYRGAERLGFATRKYLMYQQCRQSGLDDEEFVVFCIEPQLTEIFLGPMLLD